MGSGYAASVVNRVDDEIVRKIVPGELGKLEWLVLEDELASWQEIADNDANTGCGDELPAEVATALEKLHQAFRERTNLELYIGFHDQENQGDIYDEVDGRFFVVEGGHIESPALVAARQKYGLEIIPAHFVTFG